MANGKPDFWPDGTPRNAAPLGSEVPMRGGHAMTRADGWANSDTPTIGWVTGAAAESNPQGAPYTPIGPGSAMWARSRPGKFTTGDQKRASRKPR
jgi:hypothetical protein